MKQGELIDQKQSVRVKARTIHQCAVIDSDTCTACGTCVKVCPTNAITREAKSKKKIVTIDESLCMACTLCETRCPEYAIEMAVRPVPLVIGDNLQAVSSEAVESICRKAHMYPDQVVCYCHRVQAKEVAAAILLGATTPEEISAVTRARAGCGVLCITGVIRMLRAAGIEPDRPPGNQWYAAKVTIWDIPEKVHQKYPQYMTREDRKAMDEAFPGGDDK